MLPMKQVLSRTAKGPAPGTLIAMQLLTLAPKPVPAELPRQVFEFPLRLLPASSPTAVLSEPPSPDSIAPAPTAVFEPPLSTSSAPAPTPVSKLPSLKDRTDKKPKAELYRPVVRLLRAPCPSAVLLVVRVPPGSGVSVALCTCWQSPKHTSADMAVVNITLRIFIL